MRVVVDATPLLGTRTGIGRYTSHLLEALAALRSTGTAEDLELVGTAFSWRGLDALPSELPAGVAARAHRAPARFLQAAWSRTEFPPVEWLAGRADVVHATNYVLPPLRRAGGVVTVHDLSYLRLPDTVTSATARYRKLVPRSLRRAAVVLSDSEAIAAEVSAEYGVEVSVTPLGVDSAWLSVEKPTAEWLRGQGLPERYLLFVGTLEPRKNLPTLLTAYRALRAADPDAPPLVLVGPAGWGPALDTAGLGPADIIQLGYLDESALRSVVAGAAVLCFPSLYEGFGLPPLEALAAGTPVVASDIPTTREVCAELAELTPPLDADALTDALARTLAAPPNPERGRAHAATYTWARTAELTLAAYRVASG
jgi:glycosyltransferase involved in cell wall biosynthesis